MFLFDCNKVASRLLAEEKGVDAQAVEAIRSLCREVVEETTTRGYRVKFIL